MPSNIVKSLAEKTGININEVEAKWKEAKEVVRKHTNEKDEKFYPTVVTVLKKMLNVNEDAPAGGGATTTAGIANVPKRLGEKPKQKLEYDGNLNGYPFFNIENVGDYLQIAQQKRANQKIKTKDQRVHQHLQSSGSPFLMKHQNWTIKLTKKDF